MVEDKGGEVARYFPPFCRMPDGADFCSASQIGGILQKKAVFYNTEKAAVARVVIVGKAWM